LPGIREEFDALAKAIKQFYVAEKEWLRASDSKFDTHHDARLIV